MTKAQKSEIARALAALRKTHAGGRPKRMRRCKKCGERFGAREMRAHIPQCGVNHA